VLHPISLTDKVLALNQRAVNNLPIITKSFGQACDIFATFAIRPIAEILLPPGPQAISPTGGQRRITMTVKN
jgi:hypothetical protein